jgi:pectate lyase
MSFMQDPRLVVHLFSVCILLPWAVLGAQTKAFPGAEGFGRFATGGRGGEVIEVTTLADSGSGTLRNALAAAGPRTVVFRVAGTIRLRQPLVIHNGDLTVAGHTSPGDGICVRDYPVRVEADNVIIRFLRFRLGDVTRVADDALSGGVVVDRVFRNIIVDHCSMSWGIDECSSFYDVADFTMQWCFITESLDHSYHPKGDHGYGGIWGGYRSSFHHNLFAHHTSRNPRFNGSRYGKPGDTSLVDFRNNVIYNWGFNSAYGGEAGHQNVVANYYKYGPATHSAVRNRILQPTDVSGTWYVAGNFVWGDTAVTADNWNGGVQGEYAKAQKERRRLTPFRSDSVTTQAPESAFDLVLAHAGATLPRRDQIDVRIENEVHTGTAHFGGRWGAHRGIIDSQKDVGGWPNLGSAPAPEDTDHDGIPDDWERRMGLNPGDARDGASITSTGYSNLETYLNELTLNEHTLQPPDVGEHSTVDQQEPK